MSSNTQTLWVSRFKSRIIIVENSAYPNRETLGNEITNTKDQKTNF